MAVGAPNEEFPDNRPEFNSTSAKTRPGPVHAINDARPSAKVFSRGEFSFRDADPNSRLKP